MIWIFHGYTQSGENIKKTFHKVLGSSVDLFCPDGPVTAEQGYGWWKLARENLREVPSPEEIQRVCELGQNYRETLGNPNIVIGFSQGASCLTLLISRGIISPEKVILFSNFALPHYLNSSHKIKIPSLHLFGLNDKLLFDCVGFPDLSNPSSTKAWVLQTADEWSLLPYYENPRIEFHRWGHVVPSTKIYREMISEFTKN